MQQTKGLYFEQHFLCVACRDKQKQPKRKRYKFSLVSLPEKKKKKKGGGGGGGRTIKPCIYILRMCASRPQFPISLSTRSPHIVLMCFYGEGYNRVDGFIVECRAVYVWSSYLRPNLFTRPCTQFPSFLSARPAADLFVSQRQLCPSHPDYGVSSTDRWGNQTGKVGGYVQEERFCWWCVRQVEWSFCGVLFLERTCQYECTACLSVVVCIYVCWSLFLCLMSFERYFVFVVFVLVFVWCLSSAV